MLRAALAVPLVASLGISASAQTAPGTDPNDWRQNKFCDVLFVPQRDRLIVNAKLPNPRTVEDLRKEFAPRTITRDRPMTDRKSVQRLTYSFKECEQAGHVFFVGSVRGTEDTRYHTGETFRNTPVGSNTVYDLTP